MCLLKSHQYPGDRGGQVTEKSIRDGGRLMSQPSYNPLTTMLRLRP